ncbi:MAG: adenylate/guanylate cyclase domain-containing protein [Cyclobacteriaceae bacterium]
MAGEKEQQNTFGSESLVFEIKRIKLLFGLFGLITLLSIMNLLFAEEQVLEYFSSKRNYAIVIFNSILFMVFLAGRYVWISKAPHRLDRLPPSYQYLSAITEISFPTFALAVLIYVEDKGSMIDSPAFIFYFLFLISSVFYLNPKVSVLSGLVAGLSYSAIIVYAHTPEFNFPEVAYHARSFLLMLGGLIAGAVAQEIRLRIKLAIQNAAESERVESLFNQQVSTEIVEALKDKNQITKQLQVTIMFLDIRGFTSIVEHMSPEQINQFQNAVLGPLIEIINKHHGVVNQLLGDGFMASFGAPLERDDHSLLALRAAMAIFAHLEQARHEQKVNVGIGMHSGTVVTGNIGTQQRQQYSISGTAVIVAARLEQLNKQYQSYCLVSRTFYQAAKSEITSHQKLGEISIKGIGEPVEVIQLK